MQRTHVRRPFRSTRNRLRVTRGCHTHVLGKKSFTTTSKNIGLVKIYSHGHWSSSFPWEAPGGRGAVTSRRL